MTKEELKQEAEEWCKKKNLTPSNVGYFTADYCEQSYIAGAEPREKRIKALEEKISVLLSCKNCSENKGGLLCQKEYEDKCLAQKIQYIKELQEENAELKKELEISRRCWQDQKNISLDTNCKLHKAKEIIKNLLSSKTDFDERRFALWVWKEEVNKAEQFLK